MSQTFEPVKITPQQRQLDTVMYRTSEAIDLVRNGKKISVSYSGQSMRRRVLKTPLLFQLQDSIHKVRSVMQRDGSAATAERPAIITAIIPAHNEEESIADTIESLLRQSRRVDKIVVMVNNSSDATAERTRLYADSFPRGYIVVEDESDIQHGKVGALGYAWERHGRSSMTDFVLFMDADVAADAECVMHLEQDVISRPNAAGVRASYSFAHAAVAKGYTHRLVLAQRHEFAGVELRDRMRGDRTHILGGQMTLFRAHALEEVASRQPGLIPHNYNSAVEDADLTDKLRQRGYDTHVSRSARANVGPMTTPHSLRSQRIKWTHGHISDATRDREWTRPHKHMHLWRQQVSMAWNLMIRLLFVTTLLVAVTLNMFVFVAWWLIPSVLAVAYNVMVAWKIPGRTNREVIRSLLFFPDEIALWRTLSVWVTCWYMILIGKKTDTWGSQYLAESSKKVYTVQAWVGVITTVLIPYTLIMLCNRFTSDLVVSNIISVMWIMASVMTIVSSVLLTLSIVRLAVNYRRLSLA